MAYTQQQIDELKAIIATGQESGMYSDGSQWKNRPLAELREILAEMEADLAGANVPRARTIRVNTRKGW